MIVDNPTEDDVKELLELMHVLVWRNLTPGVEGSMRWALFWNDDHERVLGFIYTTPFGSQYEARILTGLYQ